LAPTPRRQRGRVLPPRDVITPVSSVVVPAENAGTWDLRRLTGGAGARQVQTHQAQTLHQLHDEVPPAGLRDAGTHRLQDMRLLPHAQAVLVQVRALRVRLAEVPEEEVRVQSRWVSGSTLRGCWKCDCRSGVLRGQGSPPGQDGEEAQPLRAVRPSVQLDGGAQHELGAKGRRLHAVRGGVPPGREVRLQTADADLVVGVHELLRPICRPVGQEGGSASAETRRRY
jgi:hypothetical protein